MKDEKEQVLVYITRETRIIINRYIGKNYLRPYGALSHFFEEAVLRLIEGGDGVDTQLHRNSVLPSRLDGVCSEIVQYLKNQGYTLQFTQNNLYHAIGAIRGTDNRTIKKWHKTLIEYGWVQHANSTGMIFIFGSKGRIDL